ncbi:hypothetical protein HYH03_001668 [Edaphochlamys debaryana]|uniref:Uncharacterized protein n=1 Tax=Edaphochlamys debaryana TaxID=47281 RepID=A0A835YFQ0_9CHLO|nr:hypothetical protein HYH03_001668 [Edaphochlamys debaryana]|eukprot:KAG2500909.1 hypothetical protein HYH03_001668 [Edaphochlamys debaryana]
MLDVFSATRVVLWALVAVLVVDRSSAIPLPAEGAVRFDGPQLPCLTPALYKGDIHVVIGGHLPTCHFRYIADMGLTNAEVFKYRKSEDEQPLRSWQLRCGITVHERLLLPNVGNEAIALYSYVLEFYRRLPRLGVYFIHDHGASWHQTCEALFARSRLWYGEAVQRGPMAERMLSFTSKPGPHEDVSQWQGGRRRLSWFWSAPDAAVVQGLLSRWNVSVSADQARLERGRGTRAGSSELFISCCASFVVPSASIAALPLGLYDDLARYIVSKDAWVSGRHGFEYIIFTIFSNATLDDTAVRFYDATKAAGLELAGNPALEHCRRNLGNSTC